VIASLENFLRPPRSCQKSYDFGSISQNLFALQFQYIVTLEDCNKASIKKSPAHHSSREEGFPGSLVLSHKRCFAGELGLSGGLGPLGPPRNLITGLEEVVNSPSGVWGVLELSKHVWTHTASFGQSCYSCMNII